MGRLNFPYPHSDLADFIPPSRFLLFWDSHPDFSFWPQLFFASRPLTFLHLYSQPDFWLIYPPSTRFPPFPPLQPALETPNLFSRPPNRFAQFYPLMFIKSSPRWPFLFNDAQFNLTCENCYCFCVNFQRELYDKEARTIITWKLEAHLFFNRSIFLPFDIVYFGITSSLPLVKRQENN